VGQVARELGLEEAGYRLLTNVGMDAGQEVPHFHVHLLAGRPLGRMVAPADG
jgi:diadenosine tetraphosphate (Ap4A) HIT family hydrolase